MLSDRSLADYRPMSAHGSIVIISQSGGGGGTYQVCTGRPQYGTDDKALVLLTK